MAEMVEVGDKLYTVEELWDVHLKQLAVSAPGALEIQEIMDWLGINDLPVRQRFLAFATEFKAIAIASHGMAANRPQILLIAQKWGVKDLVERFAGSLKDKDDPSFK